MDTNITIPKKEIAPGVFTTGGVATVPSNSPATVITPKSLQNQTKIDLTGTNISPTLDTGIVNNAIQNTQAFDTQAEFQRQLDLQKQATPDQTPLNNILKQLTESEQNLGGMGEAQLTAEVNAGIPEAQKARSTLQGQIKSQLAEYNALKSEFEKMSADIEAGAGRKGLTTGAVMGQQGAVDRAKLARLNSKASEIGLLQAKDLALAGDIETAQNTINRAIDLKYKDKEAENKIIQAQYNRIKDTLTGEETKRGKALEEALKKEAANLADKKAITTELAKAGVIDTKLYDSIQNAGTFTDAIKIAAQYLKTTSNDVIKLDNGQTIMIDKNTGAIIKNFGGAKAEEGGVSSSIDKTFTPLIGTVSNLETTVAGKKAVSDQMAQYIKNQDWTSTYNQIANSVENSLTGTTKTRYADARIDYEVMGGLKNAVQQFIDAGGSTGLLTGTAEQIERKLGRVSDPKLATLAVQLQREFQAYRNNMTGAAFTPQESREYESVNPSSKKSLNLNLSVIDGARSQLKNRIDSTIKSKVPQATSVLQLSNAVNPSNVFSNAVKSTTTSVFTPSSGWVIPTATQ